MLEGLGFDSAQGVDLYRCKECGELYGKLPGSLPLKECARCKEREYKGKMKERVYEAQKSALSLAHAIQEHREGVEKEYDATEFDKKLWAILETIELPNDAPSGIIAVIE